MQKILWENKESHHNNSTEIKKIGIEETYMNIVKVVCEKSLVIILVNREKLKVILIWQKTRHTCSLFTHIP